jgi:hypothetical protein
MDSTARTWEWLPQQMPGVAALVREKRKEFGNAHVNECWRRGVVAGEPGWFFAREGTLAVGTPWDDAELANFAAKYVTPTQAFVMIAKPQGQANGAA